MNIKVVYNGEMGFAQTVKNVYDYLIPTKRISFDKFIKYTYGGKSNAYRVYERMGKMDFSYYQDESDINNLYDYKDEEGYVLKSFDKIKKFIHSGEIGCPVPCNFYVDSENVSEGIILQSGNLIQVNDDNSSNYDNDNDQIIFDLINKNAQRKNKSIKLQNGSTREHVKPLVWVWCKSLCPNGKFIPNSIFNLTPFVNSISVTENESGGNFSINLLSVEGELNDKGGLKSIWSPTSNSYTAVEDSFIFRKMRNKLSVTDNYPEDRGELTRNDAYNPSFGKDNTSAAPKVNINSEVLILDKNKKEKEETEKVKVNNLFTNLISPNDVIFISFINQAEEVVYVEDFFTDNTLLPSLNWDMIGLVNSVDSSSEVEGGSSEESIQGMDCMKLLIEDGTYFFMNSSGTDTPTSIFENIQIEQQGDQGNVGMIDENNRKSSNRTPLGLISSLYIPTQRNIGFIMNLLLGKLCNVEICPTKLFEHYGDKKTYYNIPILSNTNKK